MGQFLINIGLGVMILMVTALFVGTYFGVAWTISEDVKDEDKVNYWRSVILSFLLLVFVCYGIGRAVTG